MGRGRERYVNPFLIVKNKKRENCGCIEIDRVCRSKGCIEIDRICLLPQLFCGTSIRRGTG